MSEYPTASRKKKAFEALRREILGARLKVTIDAKRGIPTSPKVRALAEMKLPPVTTAHGVGRFERPSPEGYRVVAAAGTSYAAETSGQVVDD